MRWLNCVRLCLAVAVAPSLGCSENNSGPESGRASGGQAGTGGAAGRVDTMAGTELGDGDAASSTAAETGEAGAAGRLDGGSAGQGGASAGHDEAGNADTAVAGGDSADGGEVSDGGPETDAAVGMVGQGACLGAAYDPLAPPKALTLSGNLGAHDPAAYVVGKTIYLAATGLTGKTSTNLTSWTGSANPLATPGWAKTATGATELWAPDISFFGGAYHLYYAASTFGHNKSCIGQATRAALDSGSWADQGRVICSNVNSNDDWNAIDPNIVVDDDGTPWLALGSFWSGLKMVKLKLDGTLADTTVYALANGANSRGSLEGAWVFKRCGYYYLFSSWGACCDTPFGYNIRVGRSKTVTGPYVDKAGVSLMSGGGTELVKGNESWSAPGHNAVIVYENRTYNVYHALAAPSGSNGPATLRIAEIVWDADGWPVSGGP